MNICYISGMTTIKKDHKKHFPYQHPTFGRGNKKKHPDSWKKTVYYWWWSYLKRNQEYLNCCERGGQGKLSSLYQNFGDVRSDDFKFWWSENNRGMRLFSNRSSESVVEVLGEGDVVKGSGSLTVSFPLNLPKRYLKKRLNELLIKHHTGKRGFQQAKSSDASYKFKGQPNFAGLERALKVYDHLKELELQGIKKPQWKVAMDLNVVEDDFRVHRSDTPKTAEDKRRKLTAIIGRLKKRAIVSIRNAGNGVFP